MFRVFMELDEAYNDRQFYIDEIKKAGKNYNFNKYTDAQLYRMWQRLQKPAKIAKEPEHDLDLDFEPERELDYCDCGIRLTDFGQCPVCDLGEEDLVEWLDASGKPININSVPTASTSGQTSPAQNSQSANVSNGKHVVTIIYDPGAKKLRGRADDGVNGPAWVAFPSNLRDYDGQQYEVDQLIWNGKNYRVAGNIVEI